MFIQREEGRLKGRVMPQWAGNLGLAAEE